MIATILFIIAMCLWFIWSIVQRNTSVENICAFIAVLILGVKAFNLL